MWVPDPRLNVIGHTCPSSKPGCGVPWSRWPRSDLRAACLDGGIARRRVPLVKAGIAMWWHTRRTRIAVTRRRRDGNVMSVTPRATARFASLGRGFTEIPLSQIAAWIQESPTHSGCTVTDKTAIGRAAPCCQLSHQPCGLRSFVHSLAFLAHNRCSMDYSKYGSISKCLHGVITAIQTALCHRVHAIFRVMKHYASGEPRYFRSTCVLPSHSDSGLVIRSARTQRHKQPHAAALLEYSSIHSRSWSSREFVASSHLQPRAWVGEAAVFEPRTCDISAASLIHRRSGLVRRPMQSPRGRIRMIPEE